MTLKKEAYFEAAKVLSGIDNATVSKVTNETSATTLVAHLSEVDLKLSAATLVSDEGVREKLQ